MYCDESINQKFRDVALRRIESQHEELRRLIRNVVEVREDARKDPDSIKKRERLELIEYSYGKISKTLLRRAFKKTRDVLCRHHVVRLEKSRDFLTCVKCRQFISIDADFEVPSCVAQRS